MLNIALTETLAKLPVAELQVSIQEFVEPMTKNLPDKRLQAVVCQSVQSILATETPVIAAMSRSVSGVEADSWAPAKGIYRFLENERFNHHHLFKGLYRMAQKTVEQEAPGYVVVAIDPVNFEKPYTQKLERIVPFSLPSPTRAQSRHRRG